MRNYHLFLTYNASLRKVIELVSKHLDMYFVKICPINAGTSYWKEKKIVVNTNNQKKPQNIKVPQFSPDCHEYLKTSVEVEVTSTVLFFTVMPVFES